MSANLFTRFAKSAPGRDRNFLTTPSGRALSYGEMLAQSAKFANTLARLGVRKGDRVAVQIEKSPEAILLYLACLRAGAIYLPLNTAYTLLELEYFIGDAEPKLVVCAPAKLSAMAPMVAAKGVKAIETLSNDGLSGSFVEKARIESAQFEDVVVGGDTLASILYTSGTTGRSKGAMLSHDNLGSNAYALKEIWRITDQDVLLHALPVFHVHGLFVATNSILAAGASMLFLPKFDPDEVFRQLPHATMMMGVPTFYVRLLQDLRLNRESAAHMRLFISGSAPLLADTHREFHERTGHAILERYGMTETNMITSNPYAGDRVPGAVGIPLPGVSVRIADPEHGGPIAKGEIGMIEVKGPNVLSGYWRMPEKNKTEFRADGYFITGDLGKIDENGYVHIVGRGKDLIISGGFNVYPKEVEEQIDALSGVIESAVIGVPHEDFGEGVTAIIVKRPGSDLSESAILSALRTCLANFKLPKRCIFLDDLPRNTMGKVQKAALRETYRTLYGK